MHSRYLDIASQIRTRIEANEWAPGAHLPRLNDLAAEYGANRDTIGRAIAALETEGYVWAVQGSGIVVRYGTMRPRRPRGDLVKRNEQSLGYSFPSASSQEVCVRHGHAVNAPARLNDPRIAKLLGVKPGTEVLRRLRVTGPASEAPFQINISWIHPRVADLVVDVDANPAAGEWLYRIEKAGHWPIRWVEFHRARMPSKEEAAQLEIPTSLPVLEIVRQGLSGSDDQPVEVTEYVIASDRVETVHVLHRDELAQAPWPDSQDGSGGLTSEGES
ncbi:GntR family transcriptional regulator [Dactylosporangium sucinum]|uniref:GntR family transcriptional regulator n=1 Tax=Dactylosporangium sucinum TaxID=1424081 RepID=UPI00227B5BE9|nr:GntR family transcriptional regulator [Dactylosporangium sucinum]